MFSYPTFCSGYRCEQQCEGSSCQTHLRKSCYRRIASTGTCHISELLYTWPTSIWELGGTLPERSRATAAITISKRIWGIIIKSTTTTTTARSKITNKYYWQQGSQQKWHWQWYPKNSEFPPTKKYQNTGVFAITSTLILCIEPYQCNCLYVEKLIVVIANFVSSNSVYCVISM